MGENILYNYTTKSNKSGIFDINTLFRINNSKWPDLLREDKIEIRPPEIQVEAKADQFYAIREEPLDLDYNIIYKSGWCNEKIDLNLSFNDSERYDIFIKGNSTKYKKYNGSPINIKLTPLETTVLSIQVEYHNAGKHSIPMAKIEGATVNQQDLDIEVMPGRLAKLFQDYGTIISILIAGIGILITAIELRIQFNEIRKLKKDKGK